MLCQRCQSERILYAESHGRDCHSWKLANSNFDYEDGYLPHDLGIGGGDDLRVRYCLDCGQLQGKFPIHPESLEVGFDDSDEEDFYK